MLRINPIQQVRPAERVGISLSNPKSTGPPAATDGPVAIYGLTRRAGHEHQ